MTTAAAARPVRQSGRVATTTARGHYHHWYWLAAGLVLFFSIPFVLTDLRTIDRDVYYGIYIAAAFGFFALWLRYANASARVVLTRNRRAGIALGVLFGAVLAAIVLKEPATNHPDGLGFAAAILWRGVLYGLADGLVLSAFPILAVFAAFGGTAALRHRRGKVAVGALALAMSLVFTAVYHLGYSDFRGDKLRKPLAGDVIWSAPTLFTLSPLGAPIAHAGLHVTAVVHSYETDIFLPPHARGPSAAAAPATPADDLAVVHVFVPRRGPGTNCARVYPLERTVRKPAVLTGAMRALLAGPTAAERSRGYGGWFSSKTANKLHTVQIGRGVAYVDFYDFRRVIPSASSSCGSALLLAELNATATQFPSVRRAVYSFNGDRRVFYEWLQRDAPRAGGD